jgi:hypothetical protein
MPLPIHCHTIHLFSAEIVYTDVSRPIRRDKKECAISKA